MTKLYVISVGQLTVKQEELITAAGLVLPAGYHYARDKRAVVAKLKAIGVEATCQLLTFQQCEAQLINLARMRDARFRILTGGDAAAKFVNDLPTVVSVVLSNGELNIKLHCDPLALPAAVKAASVGRYQIEIA